jgi:hypothetical protein
MVVLDVIRDGNNIFHSVLRGGKMAAWLRIIVYPIQFISDKFDAFALDKREELRYNGQVIYLEKLLNDRFDNNLRRITITDPTASVVPLPVVFRIEDDAWFNSVVINNWGQSLASDTFLIFNYADVQTQFDFVVNVPNALSPYTGVIDGLVKQYKEASKVFQINLT